MTTLRHHYLIIFILTSPCSCILLLGEAVACDAFFRSLVTLFFWSLVTLFISTCISPAQARAKCVSVYMECSGGEHRARILHKRVSLTASSRCQLSGTVLGAGTVHAYVSQTR